MELTLLYSLLIFLWISAITPGPNNLLLTSSGANFGYAKSLPLLLGILTGVQLILLFVALGVGGLIIRYPSLHLLLKIAGSFYLLWLGWKLVTASYLLPNSGHVVKPLSFWQASILQLINPKAWMMGLGSIASFTSSDKPYVMLVMVISLSLLIINVIAGLIWLAFGVFIQRLLSNRKNYIIFNLIMGLMTISCIFLLWL